MRAAKPAAPTFPMVPYRRPMRLAGYDYRQIGGYFITICTEGRIPLFGVLSDGHVLLSWAGQIVQEEWLRTPQIRREIKLDEWIVMPDHFHAIVFIEPTEENGRVGAAGWPPANEGSKQFTGIPPANRSLSRLINQFKATTTRRINQWRQTPDGKVWQRGYYDRIIRNDVELDKMRKYIRNNLSSDD